MVIMVTSWNSGPRIISWIALSVSISTADVAGTEYSINSWETQRTSESPSSKTMIFDFLNNARAKHNSWRCPELSGEPPSLTSTSSPSGKLSTNSFRCACRRTSIRKTMRNQETERPDLTKSCPDIGILISIERINDISQRPRMQFCRLRYNRNSAAYFNRSSRAKCKKKRILEAIQL